MIREYENRNKYAIIGVHIEGAAMLLTSRAMSTRLETNAMSNHTSDSPTLQISLSQGYETTIDEIDSDLNDFRWTISKTKENKYAICKSFFPNKPKIAAMHRVIMQRILGRDLVKGEMVDHVDNNGLNNRRENLRLANKSQNARNRGAQRNNSSGYKGVSWNKPNKKWIVGIAIDSKKIYLGQYHNIHDAARAWNAAALKYHGEFAYQNVIPDEDQS